MLTFNMALVTEFKKLLGEEAERLKECLTQVGLVESTYSTWRGQIIGIRAAMELCDEAKVALEKRERGE
jgi:hypothetical protein